MNKPDMARIPLAIFQFVFSTILVFVFRACWGFQKKVGSSPMDLAPFLRGSFLPRREDGIPSWIQLLALFLG